VATLPSLENQLNYCTVLHVPVPSVVEVPVLIMFLVAYCWRCKDRYLLLEVYREMVFVVGGVRMDGVCCWRCKDRWCLLFEMLG